ncbi:MAG: hypothetical protein NTW32_00725 [Chloroflexi bacterium]|nr:hypothetical protein [Chloroflexota bacterium]
MYFEAEFYTYDHVVRGLVDTPHERLSDLMNLKNETSIMVREAQISQLLGMGKSAPIQMSELRMEKHSILFAYPDERDMTTKSIYRRASRQVYPICVLLPNFELFGSVHLTEKMDIRRVLLSRSDDFIPITDATVIYSLYPAITIRRSTIIFNKNQMILIGEHVPNPVPTNPAQTQPQGPN